MEKILFIKVKCENCGVTQSQFFKMTKGHGRLWSSSPVDDTPLPNIIVEDQLTTIDFCKHCCGGIDVWYVRQMREEARQEIQDYQDEVSNEDL